MRRRRLIPLFALLAVAACQRASPPAPPAAAEHPAQGMQMPMQVPQTVEDWAQGAQRFERLGAVHRTVSTHSVESQHYFDQGLSLMWGFNHDEATRSFAKAAELDPHCAACYWAVALTVGPNYNLPFLTSERARVAFEALHRAQAEAAGASPVEQALITALAARYPNAQPLDPSTSGPVMRAYAAAMQQVAQRFADDLDVQTLYAESLMNLRAWKLWTPQGQPAEGTEEIVRVLEGVLRRDPSHVGANHYYVHTIEASPHPERALEAADRLRSLVPGAGHLVHMPSHIYQRVGRYDDSVEANRNAAIEDEKYNALTRPPDYYGMYTAHNYQFLAYSAAMAGRRAETLDAVERSRAAISDDMLLQMPGADWYVAEYYLARVRFGLWQELLALPPPDRRVLGMHAAYLYSRAMALAALGRSAEARDVSQEFGALASAVPADAGAGQNLLKDVLAVATPVIAARIAESEHRPEEVIRQLQEAVKAEDRLSYDEPRNWFTPSRHVLGAALLTQRRPRDAEAVYRADLLQNPDNGWALYGLKLALEAQHRRKDAEQAGAAFDHAWRSADIPLTASAF